MTNHAFPAIGRRYLADYGQVVFLVDFATDGKTLRWAEAAAPDFDAAAHTETYSATQVRPGVFWVTWQEADGTTVSHVEDFENDVVHASITTPAREFLTLTGQWTPVA